VEEEDEEGEEGEEVEVAEVVGVAAGVLAPRWMPCRWAPNLKDIMTF
jgi:hypothetical protein